MPEASGHSWWTLPALVGFILVPLGLYFVLKGVQAKAMITAALRDENVTTGEGSTAPPVPVTDAKTAEVVADLIKKNSLQHYGRFTDMARDDPNRDDYLRGLTLRNSLHLAVLGFGVADLAIATGAVTLSLGVALFGLAMSVKG